MAELMVKLLGPNWKTTLTGLITAGFAFVLFSPELFQQWPLLISLSKFAAAGGLAVMGIVSKDRNTTGGTVAQDDKIAGNPPAVPAKAPDGEK